jgi:hypothetical protein
MLPCKYVAQIMAGLLWISMTGAFAQTRICFALMIRRRYVAVVIENRRRGGSYES